MELILSKPSKIAYITTIIGATFLFLFLSLDEYLYPEFESLLLCPIWYQLSIYISIVISFLGIVLSIIYRNAYTYDTKEIDIIMIILIIGLFLFFSSFSNKYEDNIFRLSVGFSMMISGLIILTSSLIASLNKGNLFMNKYKLLKGFPDFMKKEVEEFIKLNKKYFKNDILIIGQREFTLLDNNKVYIPYRTYYKDFKYNNNTINIYYLFMSRCIDGYKREEAISYILKNDIEDYMLPYIMLESETFVKEIVSNIYNSIKEEYKEKMKIFALLNVKSLILGYYRNVSYYNFYYKKDYKSYKEYPGYLLYKNIYGYRKCLMKL